MDIDSKVSLLVDELKSIFNASRNPKKQEQMEAYMKYKFTYYGIPSPIRKTLSKDLFQLIKPESIEVVKTIAQTLWNEPQRELHYFAMELLDKHKKKLNNGDLKFGELLVTTNSWWDTIDFLATHFFYPILKALNDKDEEKYVRYLAAHDDMWMNRIGIIYQLKSKMETKTKLLEIAILPHIESTEFFHRKAIGWALRQYSKFNPDYVRSFLDQYTLSGLSVREASKYLK